jgi:hypothetical protein
VRRVNVRAAFGFTSGARRSFLLILQVPRGFMCEVFRRAALWPCVRRSGGSRRQKQNPA